MAGSNPLHMLMRVPVPWVFILAYLIGAGAEYVWPSHRVAWPMAIVWAGAVLFAAGAVLATWCLIIFRKERTTTVPGKASRSLITRGPYRLTRNPMYVALSMAYLGEAGLLRQFWPVLFLPLVLAYLNWVVIPVEESRLSEVFGTQYAEFKARVARWV